MYRGRNWAYVYDGDDNNTLFGKIGRSIDDSTHAPPDRKFEELSFERWEVAPIFLSLNDGEDIQKLAIGFDPKVRPSAGLLAAWADEINKTHHKSVWAIEINPIVEQASFWKAYRENRSKITEAEFIFIVPNPLGFHEETAAKLRELRDEEGAQQVGVDLKAAPGQLKLDTTRIKYWVDYILDGAGRLILRGGQRSYFDSSKDETKKVEVKTVNDMGVQVARREILTVLFRDFESD
ncbi:hypothetical protein NF552_02550 [Roseomonas mucosa]|nr:hypothetical protein NF552_02550 [Roseomonas mucosa]